MIFELILKVFLGHLWSRMFPKRETFVKLQHVNTFVESKFAQFRETFVKNGFGNLSKRTRNKHKKAGGKRRYYMCFAARDATRAAKDIEKALLERRRKVITFSSKSPLESCDLGSSRGGLL